MSELPKTFDPKAIEERWYAHWEDRGLFRPDRGDATPWTIVMPRDVVGMAMVHGSRSPRSGRNRPGPPKARSSAPDAGVEVLGSLLMERAA